MSLSRLAQQCQVCPYVLSCTHKRMEAVAYMKEASAEVAKNAAQPVMIPHDYRDIKIAESMTVTIDVEDIKKQLEQSIYKNIGLMFGA